MHVMIRFTSQDKSGDLSLLFMIQLKGVEHQISSFWMYEWSWPIPMLSIEPIDYKLFLSKVL